MARQFLFRRGRLCSPTLSRLQQDASKFTPWDTATAISLHWSASRECGPDGMPLRSRRVRWNLLELLHERALRVPDVVGVLHREPEIRPVACPLTQSVRPFPASPPPGQPGSDAGADGTPRAPGPPGTRSSSMRGARLPAGALRGASAPASAVAGPELPSSWPSRRSAHLRHTALHACGTVHITLATWNVSGTARGPGLPRSSRPTEM